MLENFRIVVQLLNYWPTSLAEFSQLATGLVMLISLAVISVLTLSGGTNLGVTK